MRADRELRHSTAVGREEVSELKHVQLNQGFLYLVQVTSFKEALSRHHGYEMASRKRFDSRLCPACIPRMPQSQDGLAHAFWRRPLLPGALGSKPEAGGSLVALRESSRAPFFTSGCQARCRHCHMFCMQMDSDVNWAHWRVTSAESDFCRPRCRHRDPARLCPRAVFS